MEILSEKSNVIISNMGTVKDVTDKKCELFFIVFANKDLCTHFIVLRSKPILIQQREIELLNRIRLHL